MKLNTSALGKYEGGMKQAKADFSLTLGKLKAMKIPAVVTTHNLGSMIDLGDFKDQKGFELYYGEIKKQKGKIEIVENIMGEKSTVGQLSEEEIKDLEENGEMDAGQDFSGHRQIISHALKGEPAQIAPIFNSLVRDKISDRMETTRAEVGANMFGGDEN